MHKCSSVSAQKLARDRSVGEDFIERLQLYSDRKEHYFNCGVTVTVATTMAIALASVSTTIWWARCMQWGIASKIISSAQTYEMGFVKGKEIPCEHQEKTLRDQAGMKIV